MRLNTLGRVLIEMKGMGVNRRLLPLGPVISRALWYETKAHVLATLLSENSPKQLQMLL